MRGIPEIMFCRTLYNTLLCRILVFMRPFAALGGESNQIHLAKAAAMKGGAPKSVTHETQLSSGHL